jgi:hypothetical protein
MDVKPGLSRRRKTQLENVSERVQRRIFGLKMDDVTRGWRKLYNEKLHNLYPSPNIIKMIKSRRIRYIGHVAPM